MIEELKAELAEHKIAYLNTDKGIKFKGEADFDIDIFAAGSELIMLLGEAHHHCDNVAEVLEILSYVIEGNLKIINKLRGNTVVGTQIQLIDSAGTIKVLEHSGLLISPFWKEKSFEEKYFKKN